MFSRLLYSDTIMVTPSGARSVIVKQLCCPTFKLNLFSCTIMKLLVIAKPVKFQHESDNIPRKVYSYAIS